jgi:hypothetical protein
MVTFVLRFATTSPSSKYKTINSRIFYRIVSSYMQIATSFWKVLCHLFIKFKKRTRLSLQQGFLPSVLYMSYRLPTLTWSHQSTSVAVWVQIASLTLSHCIEVSVPSQKRVNDHVYACCAYRFCLHFYLFLIQIRNGPDGDALNWFSYFGGKIQLELYLIIFQKLPSWIHGFPSLYQIFFWYAARKDLTQHRKWRAI